MSTSKLHKNAEMALTALKEISSKGQNFTSVVSLATKILGELPSSGFRKYKVAAATIGAQAALANAESHADQEQTKLSPAIELDGRFDHRQERLDNLHKAAEFIGTVARFDDKQGLALLATLTSSKAYKTVTGPTSRAEVMVTCMNAIMPEKAKQNVLSLGRMMSNLRTRRLTYLESMRRSSAIRAIPEMREQFHGFRPLGSISGTIGR